MRKTLCLALTLCMMLVGAANAGVITHTDTVPLQSTNFTKSVTIPKYNGVDPLLKIEFILAGHVEGDAKYENKDAEPATVTAELKASLTLQRPDLSTLVVSIPTHYKVEDLPKFDGVEDFAGTSGRTYTGLSADKSESSSSTTAADKALFSGVGNIVLPVDATGQSYASGPGNIASEFATSASADVTVKYYYDSGDQVPEPAGLALLGLLGLVRRKRR